MNAPQTPEVGSIITFQGNEVIEAAQGFAVWFGMDISRDMALFVLAAGLFFFGVALSCVLRINGNTHPLKVILGSVVVFLLCSPAWAYTLEGDWRNGASMPLIDDLFRWLQGAAPMPRKLFSLGIVILMGMVSWPILQRILKFIGDKISKDDDTPPAAPTPATG